MNNLKKYLLVAGMLIWGVIVIKYFLDSHITYNIFSDYFKSNRNGFGHIFSTFLFSFLFSSGALYFLKKNINPFWGLGLFLLNTFAVFVFYAFKADLLGTNISSFSILLTLSFMTLGASFFTLLLMFLGDLMTKLLPKQNFNLLEKFLGGFIFMSFFGFLLGKIVFFDVKVFLLVIALGAVFWESFVKILSQIKNVRLGDEEELSIIQVLLGGLIMTVLGLNILQTFFPFSLAWDSSNMYLLTVKDLIETGVLRTGIFPPFTEIVMSVGGLFLGLGFVQFLYNFWGTLFLLSSAFILTKQINTRTSNDIILLLVTTFFLIPAVQFQLSSDLKIDILFLTTILTSWSLLLKKQERPAGLLLGFAVLQKMTAIFLWPVFLGVIFLNKEKSINLKLQAVILLVLPFSVLGIVNLIEVGKMPVNLSEAKEIIIKGKKQTPQLQFNKLKKTSVVTTSDKKDVLKPVAKKVETKKTNPENIKPVNNNVNTGWQEEIERYVGNEKNFFKKIWAIMTSPKIPEFNKRYVDLGFLFVVILPMIGFFAHKLYRNVLFWMLTVFFLAWILIFQGGAWYGFPAIILIFILGLKCFEQEKLWRMELVLFLVISMGLGLYSRLFSFPIGGGNSALGWSNSPKKETAQFLAGQPFKQEMMAAEILNKNVDKNFIIVGTMAKFWINNLDERSYDDAQLDILNKIIDENNPQNTIDFLREHNFKFILYDRFSNTIETDKNGTLNKKVHKFEKFAKNNLKQTYVGGKIILFEIP